MKTVDPLTAPDLSFLGNKQLWWRQALRENIYVCDIMLRVKHAARGFLSAEKTPQHFYTYHRKG